MEEKRSDENSLKNVSSLQMYQWLQGFCQKHTQFPCVCFA